MTYYLAAYLVFWAVLFGYLLGLSCNQERLNRRAEELVSRLVARGREVSGPGGLEHGRGTP